ncbi:MAG: ABC transporter ATP-binding protein [Desulfobacteraceae bacterium 4484_190.1]|nr:MAG: ABC transporter ATP-binding protein [Desulfobacteraceae bacterium 4484_190.1]
MDKDNLIINLTDISFSYPEGAPLLNNLSMQIYKGDRVGLIGPNGGGKTTLFHIIMGLLKPYSGKVEIFGKPVREEKDFRSVRQRIGLLFQDSDDQLFSPTVLEDVAFGPLNLGKPVDEAKVIARKTLDSLGLSGFEDRITYKLSGGEKRMVSLATVLAMEPEILLLDEPSAGLDENTRASLIKVLTGLDLSYILISHEMEFLDSTTTSVYIMKDGKVFMNGDRQIHRHYHIHPHSALPHRHESGLGKKYTDFLA